MEDVITPIAPVPSTEHPDDILGPAEAAEAVTNKLNLTKEQKAVLHQCLDSLDIDPVMIVKVRDTWVCPPNMEPSDILELLATWNTHGSRRDYCGGTRHWLYHFKNMDEVVKCHNYFEQQHPYCFGLSNNALQLINGLPQLANLPNGLPQLDNHIFADVMIVNKTDVKEDDVFEYKFFYL